MSRCKDDDAMMSCGRSSHVQ